MSKEEIIRKYEPYPNKAEVNVIGVMMDEYAKQEAIGFMTWVYSRGFFVQWKDGVAGHIRQENQILFSAWQPLESTYEQYLLHKQNNQ